MTLAQLEYAQKRMEQKWYELAMAEQHGVAMPALERLYSTYVLAMEEYNRCSAEYQCEHHCTNDLIHVTQKKSVHSTSASSENEHSKIA